MKLIPSEIELPSAPILKRHNPLPANDYAAYRQCLRWDFGFVCAFCFLHEGDFDFYGTEGTGLLSIEHLLVQRDHPQHASEYSNCVYACRYCNNSRRTAPIVDVSGRRLLNPCVSAWAAHFTYQEVDLLPIPGDRDAEYTAEVYDLGDPRKRAYREARRRLYEDYQESSDAYRRLLDLVDALLEANPREAPEALIVACEFARILPRLKADLSRYALEPRDAAACRCTNEDQNHVPEYLAQQAFEI